MEQNKETRIEIVKGHLLDSCRLLSNIHSLKKAEILLILKDMIEIINK